MPSLSLPRSFGASTAPLLRPFATTATLCKLLFSFVVISHFSSRYFHMYGLQENSRIACLPPPPADPMEIAFPIQIVRLLFLLLSCKGPEPDHAESSVMYISSIEIPLFVCKSWKMMFSTFTLSVFCWCNVGELQTFEILTFPNWLNTDNLLQ